MKTIAELNAKIKELEAYGDQQRSQLQKNVAALPPGTDRVKLGQYIDANNAAIDKSVARGRSALGSEFWRGARAAEDARGDEMLLRALKNKTLPELNEEARVANLKAKGVYGPAHKSSKAAFDAGFDPRVGIGQLLSLPLMVTDIAETGLDALRGTSSPSRWAQGTDLISRALGGPKYYQEREPSIYDWQQTAAEISNPVNFVGALPGLARRGARSALNLSDAAVRKIARDPRATAMAAIDAAGELSPLNAVVKQKGGNWLTGSVEEALRGLKRIVHRPARVGPHAVTDEMWEEYVRSNPTEVVNQWVQGPLTKYVKNQMATPEDPVRALAERGVLHYSPDEIVPFSSMTKRVGNMRSDFGFPTEGFGSSDLAKNWEIRADNALDPLTARYLQERTVVPETQPWVSKLPPETVVYEPLHGARNTTDLGLTHLVDELRNATRADSDLPRQLQIAPEKLSKMNMEAAVQHVAKINEWRAKQKAEADALRANNAATQLVREYADDSIPNPKGLRWVELRQPETLEKLPEGWRREGDNIISPEGDYHGVAGHPGSADIGVRERLLQDALKYEGDTMGHCVGGYCEDVSSGRSRIFSLRDAKGEPHVTVEVAPTSKHADPRFDVEEDVSRMAADEVRRTRPDLDDESDDFMFAVEEAATRIANKLSADPDLPPKIVQIKGKQNKAPNDEYLPFVHDFVRNSPLGTPWSEVGDLWNTGLRGVAGALSPKELKKLEELGEQIPQYLNQSEVDRFYQLLNPVKKASGGRVTAPRTPAELQAIIADIGGLYAAG